MKKTIKILSIIFALVLVLSATPMASFAADDDFVIENGVLTAYNGAGGDVVIPDGVTSIGDEAFSYCVNLASIKIPDSVTSIGSSAFSSCSALKSVTIPGNVTSIGDKAFYFCENLISIKIPDGVTSIGDEAFSYCVNLASIEIPDSVTSIGMGVFYSCITLKSVTLSGSVTSIDEYAFCWCDSLTDVYFIGTEEQRNEINIHSYNLPFTQATIHFIAKHEHMFDMAWTTNATAHWHSCFAEGCNITDYSSVEYSYYGLHEWEDGKCTVCGAKEPIADPEIISITEKSIPAVNELIDLEVLISKPVKKILFADASGNTTTFGTSSTNTVSIVNNDDGTQTWNVKLTVRHSVDEYTAKVKERASGTWSDKTYDLKIEVPAPVVADEIISVKVPDEANAEIKFGTHDIVITTGKDVSRVQVAYAGTTATYSKSSTKATVEADGDTLVWTISFNFYKNDLITYDFSSRQSSGSWKAFSESKVIYTYRNTSEMK